MLHMSIIKQPQRPYVLCDSFANRFSTQLLTMQPKEGTQK